MKKYYIYDFLENNLYFGQPLYYDPKVFLLLFFRETVILTIEDFTQKRLISENIW